ncbi:MAG: FliM/FliN family flagellar motor switch protein [Phycisphaerae bacterium]
MSISQANIDALFAETSASETPSVSGSAAGTESQQPSDPAVGEEVSSLAPGQAASIPIPQPREPDIKRILGLSVPVTVMLADRPLPIETILEVTVGTIIEFEVMFDSELLLQVADRTIGSGQAVKVGENFGLRITAIDTVPGRIDALGG